MPTYDYVCRACEHRFEHFQSMSDPLLRKCPRCKRSRLERLIGAGAGILFKGSGFYETDYKRKSPPGGADSPGSAGPDSAAAKDGKHAKDPKPTDDAKGSKAPQTPAGGHDGAGSSGGGATGDGGGKPGTDRASRPAPAAPSRKPRKDA